MLAILVPMGCAQTQAVRSAPVTVLRADATPAPDTPTDASELLEATPFAAQHARVVILPRVRTPVTQAGARRALETGLNAMSEEQWSEAASQLRAVLRTDFLTDSGRVNIYWFTAEAHRRLHDLSGEADALSGFLLAVSLLDEELQRDRREIAARAALAAIRLSHDPAFGRTKEMPIRVVDSREPETILAALGCQERVHTEERVTTKVTTESSSKKLVQQSARCGKSGRSVQLWFDVSDTSERGR